MREADAGARPQCATSGHAPTAGRRGQSTLRTPCGCWAENCPDERSDGARRTPSRTHLPLTLILFHRPLALSLDGREVLSGCRIPRIDAQGRLVVGDRAVEIALATEGRATVVVGVGEGWVKLDRAVIVGDRAAQIALGLVGVAAIGEKIRSRRDSNRLAIIDDGAVILALLRGGQAAIVEIGGLRWIKLDRLALIGNRLLIAAKLPIGRAAIGVGAVAAGIEVDRFVIILDRVFVILFEIIGGPAVPEA